MFLVIVNNFSKFGWTVPLKNKNAQTIKDSFENILLCSKWKPKIIKSDRVTVFYNNIFQNFLNENKTKNYSINTYFGAVSAERLNRTIRALLKRPVLEKSDANWIDVLPTKTKQYNNRVHTSIELTLIQASLEKNEGYVYKNLLKKRKKKSQCFE